MSIGDKMGTWELIKMATDGSIEDGDRFERILTGETIQHHGGLFIRGDGITYKFTGRENWKRIPTYQPFSVVFDNWLDGKDTYVDHNGNNHKLYDCCFQVKRFNGKSVQNGSCEEPITPEMIKEGKWYNA